MDINLIINIVYGISTCLFMWFTLKRMDKQQRLIQGLEGRFNLMCKDIRELQIRYSVEEAGNTLEEAIKTHLEYNKKPVKKGKK